MKIIDDNGADREFLERIANLEHLEKIENMSELKPCPFCGSTHISTKYSMDGDSFVYCQDCQSQGPKMPSSYISKWNQRQPHPDSAMLDWLEENTPEIWFNDNGCVLNNLGTGEGILHNSLREATQQAMEQEK